MASLIPGFEYDIFISYRQKDNKGDKWVSEFVESLKTELESTFKEEISVYFDTNPHDGLLETHDVDASLKEKLNCLIFIPVLSRIYCDPKSFAWEHEFRAFIEQASADQYGLKVKLPNGNVASRVLPVRIHDLDETDIKLCESTLGGVLRGVEFIYKSAGINRPLRSKEDKPQENLNQTIYRDQINKIALAIKELINGIKEGSGQPVADEEKGQPAARPKKRRLISVIGTLAILIAAVFVIYPFLFKKPEGKMVVAVLPFQNITKDTTLDYWQDGMQIGIISGLSGTEGLEIRSRESVSRNLEGKGITNYASLTPEIASKTSAELRSDINIQGSILMTGSKVQIIAQINDSGKDAVLTSIKFYGPRDDEWILKIMDSLSLRIKNYLLISKLIKEQAPDIGEYAITTSADALKYYLNGEKAFSKSDFHGVIRWDTKALESDSNFIAPLNDITWAYMNLHLYDQAKKWCQKYCSKKEMMTMQQKNTAELTQLYLFGTFDERMNFLKQMVEVDEFYHYMLGNDYLYSGQIVQAVSEYEKHLEVMARMNIELYRAEYTNIGKAYHEAKLYKKEKDLYRRAERDFPDNSWLIAKQASLAMITGDTAAANDYIRKYIRIRKENMATDQQINSSIVGIYYNGGNLDKAEAIFRHEVLSKDPDNPELLNGFAWFLIDNNRSVTEGLRLVERALEIQPDNYGFLDTKGWGLYKQKKYNEALICLEKSWELKPAHDQEVYTHLQEVRKAIAGQN